MERVALDVEALHLGFFVPDSLLVVALVEGTLDRQAGFRRGGPDQLDHRHAALQGLATPVLRDVAEHAVLDPVPLRGSRRIVVDPEREPSLVGELLQLDLPKPDTRTVGAAAIRPYS